MIDSQLLTHLMKKAEKKHMTNYEECGQIVGLEPNSPLLWQKLGAISEWSFKEYGFCLSSLCVNQREGVPGGIHGGQFHLLIESLEGRKIKDPVAYWIIDVKKVFSCKWKRGKVA